MSSQQGVVRVDRAKRANQREGKRLQSRISSELSVEHKYMLDQMAHKRNVAKRELAVNELERRKNKGRSSDGSTRLSRTDDPTQVLKSELEKDKQKNKLKMLEKTKKKNETMNGKVKNFMEKFSQAENAQTSEKENNENDTTTNSRLSSQKSFEDAYEEAKKTRYVRSGTREFEIELTTQEVFER